jgi:HK97 family phage prohead protease
MQNMTQKSAEFLTKSVTFKSSDYSEDDEYFCFEGYASTFGNIDLGGDIVAMGAFADSLKEGMPKMVYQHNMSQPIGIYEKAYEDQQGLYVRGKMPKANRMAQDVYSLMKCGAIDSMSIGYTVGDYEIVDSKRVLKKIKLWEVSPVTIPMNPKAKITAVKSVEDEAINKLITIHDLKNLNSKKEFETLLRDSGFSKAASIYMASLFKVKERRSESAEKSVAIKSDIQKIKQLMNEI